MGLAWFDLLLIPLSTSPFPVPDARTGFNTPGVVRFRLSNIAYTRPDSASLVRVNLMHPHYAPEIDGNTFGVQATTEAFVDGVYKAVAGTPETSE